MTAWKWINIEVVYAVHDRQISEHGGIDGCRDVGLLESALARPQHTVTYSEPDVADLAAAYTYGLIKNHSFVDGNKRTAWVIARLFLIEQGYSLKFDAIEALEVIENIASGGWSESQLSEWFRNRIIQNVIN